MVHQQLALALDQLLEELTLFLGPNPFELLRLDRVPVSHLPAGKVLAAGHDGCYLAVGTGKQSTVEFELRLRLDEWGKAEGLVLAGKYTDLRYPSDRYVRWYNSPHAHPYMLDIFDRVDRMAAYAIRLLEQAAREALENPGFNLLTSLPSGEVGAVVDYFRVPVQLDRLGY